MQYYGPCTFTGRSTLWTLSSSEFLRLHLASQLASAVRTLMVSISITTVNCVDIMIRYNSVLESVWFISFQVFNFEYKSFFQDWSGWIKIVFEMLLNLFWTLFSNPKTPLNDLVLKFVILFWYLQAGLCWKH